MTELVANLSPREEKAKLQVKISGMACSFCAETIRKAYRRVEGVTNVSVNLAHEEVLIEHNPRKVSEAQLRGVLKALGYIVRDSRQVRTFAEEEAELARERQQLIIAGATSGAALIIMLLMRLGFNFDFFPIIMIALALGTVFIVGRQILKMAWASLRRAILNQHVLLEFGAFGSLIGGFIGFFNKDFPIADFMAVAVFITSYHLLSGYSSLLVRTRSSQAVRKLLALQPPVARVVRDGQEEEVAIEEVRVDDLVRVRPGEQIPVDGVVVEGISGVDESLVTGESLLVQKRPNNEVIGGSLNQNGSLLVKVTRVGKQSFLQQIARQVEQSRALKPSIIALIDWVLKYYVPAVLIFAGLAFGIWTIGAWLVTGSSDFSRAVFAALAVGVMGYPCALGMATPLALIRGGGRAARKGILIRSGETFQVFKDVDIVVLDKTGTITKGKPQITDIIAFGNGNGVFVLKLAASVERFSEHPLAVAIVDQARQKGVEILPVQEFKAVSGKGVEARLKGKKILVGSPAFVAEESDLAKVRGVIKQLESQGKTVVVVSYDQQAVGLVAIADTPKDDAVLAITEMKKKGLQPLMITGDNEQTAKAIAWQVGIDEVVASILPDQKVRQVRRLQRQGLKVAVVGDGINDAPALMQADVGIAIGAGTDIAIESSDVILISHRLTAILDAFEISKSSYNKTVQNLILAFSFNGLGVPLAVTGLVHPGWAMIAMILSVSAVLANSFTGYK
jgi:heavy metal translocating P-type ATPase